MLCDYFLLARPLPEEEEPLPEEDSPDELGFEVEEPDELPPERGEE